MPEAPDATQQKCPGCGTLIEVGELEPLARVECPQCGEKFRVERAFDNFVIVETLGVGGMGSVYKARDMRLDRFVALKVLRKEFSTDPTEAARLEQEARMTAAVNHPNAIQVYSAGNAHGQIYLVMELVDHGSLDDLMAQQTRVPEEQVLRAGIQVARGLQAAHEKGLIHRDVKPANILFADKETAKIGDFGLAGLAEQSAEGRKEIWGTPYYVAPERLNNEPEDFRSDIYSLGATLFHAVAGKPPMEGETTSAAELRELKSHPPDLRTVAPEVTSETARVINRMLAPAPENRFTSYKQLIDQLVVAYQKVTGTSPKKYRSLIAILVLLILAAAAGGYVFHQRTLAKARAAQQQGLSPQAAALQTHFNDARRLILEGKYDPAATAFTKLAVEAGTQQPEANWARLHVGLANLLQAKQGPARDAFQQVERAAAFSNAKNDAPLVAFFTETSHNLAAPAPVRANIVSDPAPKSANAFALFLYGIKDWQMREFSDGTTLLEKFVASEPPAELGWVNDYKTLAKNFLDDGRVYAEWKQASERLTSPNEMRDAAAKAKESQGKLRMRTTLNDYLKDEERRLSASVAQQENAEKEKAKQQEATREQERRLAFENDRPRWLAQWKKMLIADPNARPYRGVIRDVPGVEFAGAAGADEAKIKLLIPGGGNNFAAMDWNRLRPTTLLAISTSFINPNAADAADRQWLSAVYAYSTGQIESGKALAETAAKTKPEYRDALNFLTQGH